MTALLVMCRCGGKTRVEAAEIGNPINCEACGEALSISTKNSIPLYEKTSIHEPAGCDSKYDFNPPVDPAANASMPTKRIGELLFEASLISRKQLATALEAQKKHGGKLVETLIKLDYLDDETFATFLARQPGIASIDLSSFEIPRELTEIIPKKYALEHEVVPIDRLGNVLTLGMVCPLDSRTVLELQATTGLTIRPVLCAPEDLRHVVEKSYHDDAAIAERGDSSFDVEEIEDIMLVDEAGGQEARSMEQFAEPAGPLSSIELERRISALTCLPVFAGVMRRIREAFENDSTTFEDVVLILSMDPSLAGKMLGVANSEELGHFAQVDSLQRAVKLLGFHEIQTIVESVSSMAALQAFGEDGAPTTHAKLWANSQHCAHGAKLVAEISSAVDKRVAFCAGLLCDLGRFVLAQVAPIHYSKIDDSLIGAELLAEEKQTVGMAHTDAGSFLAESWHFPARLVAVMRGHHGCVDREDAKELVAVIEIAEALAGLTQDDAAGDWAFVAGQLKRDCRPAVEMLDLTDAAIQRAVERHLCQQKADLSLLK